jgi:hypothetical protein
MGKGDDKEPKKKYEPPVLTVHGKIEDLTQKVGLAHSLDGGGGFFRNRTGVR